MPRKATAKKAYPNIQFVFEQAPQYADSPTIQTTQSQAQKSKAPSTIQRGSLQASKANSSPNTQRDKSNKTPTNNQTAHKQSLKNKVPPTIQTDPPKSGSLDSHNRRIPQQIRPLPISQGTYSPMPQHIPPPNSQIAFGQYNNPTSNYTPPQSASPSSPCTQFPPSHVQNIYQQRPPPPNIQSAYAPNQQQGSSQNIQNAYDPFPHSQQRPPPNFQNTFAQSPHQQQRLPQNAQSAYGQFSQSQQRLPPLPPNMRHPYEQYPPQRSPPTTRNMHEQDEQRPAQTIQNTYGQFPQQRPPQFAHGHYPYQHSAPPNMQTIYGSYQQQAPPTSNQNYGQFPQQNAWPNNQYGYVGDPHQKAPLQQRPIAPLQAPPRKIPVPKGKKKQKPRVQKTTTSNTQVAQLQVSQKRTLAPNTRPVPKKAKQVYNGRPITSLPLEVMKRILMHLNGRQLYYLQRVCSQWFHLIQDLLCIESVHISSSRRGDAVYVFDLYNSNKTYRGPSHYSFDVYRSRYKIKGIVNSSTMSRLIKAKGDLEELTPDAIVERIDESGADAVALDCNNRYGDDWDWDEEMREEHKEAVWKAIMSITGLNYPIEQLMKKSYEGEFANSFLKRYKWYAFEADYRSNFKGDTCIIGVYPDRQTFAVLIHPLTDPHE